MKLSQSNPRCRHGGLRALARIENAGTGRRAKSRPRTTQGHARSRQLRRALASIAIFYAVIAFFAWTRLVLYSALLWWLACACCLMVITVVFVHPIIVSIRHRHIPKRGYNRWWFYLIWTIAVTGLVILIGINRQILFGYEPFRIRSVSTSPSVQLDVFVLADTWRYRNHTPAPGEIVIVERPEDPGVKYIKRIVAVSGDSIEMRDGVLYRNGQAIAESYVHASVPYPGPRSHRVLERGSQQQRGQACDQRRGDRYEPPPSPAGSKRKHSRKDATAGSRAGCWAASCRSGRR